MSATLNVFGNVREYDTDLDVFGNAFEWPEPTGEFVTFCVCRSQLYRPGTDAAQLYWPGSVASDIYRPGADAINKGCC